jgi:hypothetical protein
MNKFMCHGKEERKRRRRENKIIIYNYGLHEKLSYYRIQW